MTRRALIAPRWRRGAVVAIVVAVVITTALSAWLWHGQTKPIDAWFARTLLAHIGPSATMFLLTETSPGVPIAVLAVVAGGAVVCRRADLLVLAVAGPAVSVGLSEYVLKPIVGRTFGAGSNIPAGGVYPSGHETATASAAVVALLALCQLRLGARWIAASVAVLLLWVVVTAIGLVRNMFHYFTDTIGGIGVAVVVVLGLALVIDRAPGRRRRQLI